MIELFSGLAALCGGVAVCVLSLMGCLVDVDVTTSVEALVCWSGLYWSRLSQATSNISVNSVRQQALSFQFIVVVWFCLPNLWGRVPLNNTWRGNGAIIH